MSGRQPLFGAILGSLMAGGVLLAQSQGITLGGIWSKLNARPALVVHREESIVSLTQTGFGQKERERVRSGQGLLSVRAEQAAAAISETKKRKIASHPLNEGGRGIGFAAASTQAIGLIQAGETPDAEEVAPLLLETKEDSADLGRFDSGKRRPTEILSDEQAFTHDENSVDLRSDLHLGAISKQTIIRIRPEPGSKILGFARTGALLRRAAAPAGNRGCKQGWYRVEPRGFVCVGSTATLDIEHPLIRLASMQPDRSLAMPYIYGRSRSPTPTLYTKLPSKQEQEKAEQDLRGHLQKNFGSIWSDLAGGSPPGLLAEGASVPRPYGYPPLKHDFMSGRALGNSTFAFIDLFENQGRLFGLTTDLSVVAMDRVKHVKESEFRGQILESAADLPLVYLRTHQGQYFRPTKDGKGLLVDGLIPYRAAVPITGKVVERLGMQFYETRDRRFIRVGPKVALVTARKEWPRFAVEERSWIDISLKSQTLVAYRGKTPVFTTLVSSGKGGVEDAKTSSATVQGTFLIHTKHVSATMSGKTKEDEYDLRDVPYVQYFHEGYAFHTAHWHDAFGRPYSHGCINLSPQDARFLFTWTDPPVPVGWHSALSLEGTLVQIHP